MFKRLQPLAVPSGPLAAKVFISTTLSALVLNLNSLERESALGFPRDPDHRDWCNYLWRMEPEGWYLGVSVAVRKSPLVAVCRSPLAAR